MYTGGFTFLISFLMVSAASAIQVAALVRVAAAVFTTDDALMARVTRALRVGIVWNNCSQPCFSQLPWGP